MSREIKFVAEFEGKEYHVIASHSYKQQGYIKRRVSEHPYPDKRGYVLEHRLIVEKSTGKFLPKMAVVHHINGVRDDNRIENLQIIQEQARHAKNHDIGKRNSNGHFVATEPIFQEIKFRLFNKNTGLLQVYSLAKLIGTSFRHSQFAFRGRFTGLKDKNGREIFEGDIIQFTHYAQNFKDKTCLWVVTYKDGKFEFGGVCNLDTFLRDRDNDNGKEFWRYEIIGNIYENPELLKEVK